MLAGRRTGNGREVLVDEPCGHRAIAGSNEVPEGLHDKFLVCFCWAGVIGVACIDGDHMLGGGTQH